MMRQEFIEGFKSFDPHGTESNFLELCLTREGWEAIQTCYRGRKLDAILSGRDRHEAMALWAVNHKAIVVRLYNFYSWRRLHRIMVIEKKIRLLQLDKLLA
jgi:hypothetical protein